MNTENDIDRVVEIERLAALDPIDYEVARAKAAKLLGMRSSVLDREVARKRRALGLESDDEDTGQGRAVKITDISPWHEPVDGDMLVTMLACIVKTYLVLRDDQAEAIAFWILHTWLVDEFTISPRLAITSPTKGCGKTTVLRLLNMLVRRPKRAGSISPPALFRAMEQFRPTLLLDENEKYLEVGSDFHALLNEGHCKGATVLRVLGEKLELREFAVFGAVAFARNGKLPDDLEQRSIVIELHRRKADEGVTELLPERFASLDRAARMCARWADDHRIDVQVSPDMGGLINRVADNWRPLFGIADAIGSDWPERIRMAAVALTPRDADSIGTTLLADIKTVFDGREGEWSDRIFSDGLAEGLAGIEGGAWAEWGRAKKPLTKNQLAKLLGPFKVIPASVRIGTKTAKGYYRNQFDEAWQRYLAAQGVYETSQCHNPTAAGTSTPFPNVTAESDVPFQKREKPLSPNGCDVVTDEKGGNGAHDDTHVDALDIPDYLDRRPKATPEVLLTDEDRAFMAAGGFK